MKLKERAKKTALGFLVTYCVLGSIHGCTEYLMGSTTGHGSADLYLGLKQPTKLEKLIMEAFK